MPRRVLGTPFRGRRLVGVDVPKDRWFYNGRPYSPEAKKTSGLRPSVAGLVNMVDPEDPAFGRIAAILLEMRTAGVEINEASVEIALKLGRQQRELDNQTTAVAARRGQATPLRLWPEEQGKSSIVYYIRRGVFIKIGTTTDPHSRFRDLVPDEILAWEPGGRHEEALRHRQFAHLRQQGEYFQTGPELIKHYKAIRKLHGDPDPTWRTTDTLVGDAETGSMPLPSKMPAPTSPQTVGQTEAVALLGINRSTLSVWVHRKQLRPVAIDGRGRPLYYLDHIRYLKERSRAYRKPA